MADNKSTMFFVGVARLERATACTPCKNASQLHHTPNFQLSTFHFQLPTMFSSTISAMSFTLIGANRAKVFRHNGQAVTISSG